MRLQYKITIYFSIVLLFVLGTVSIFVFGHLNKSLETQMGKNAMDMAVTVASMSSIKEALYYEEDYQKVQEIIENFRSKTRFQYIIVMDMNRIQYSYPYELGLGKYYKNGGEEKVIKNGEFYVSADRNVLISAIRAFAPIYYDDKQVGAVLVGLLTEQVNQENEANKRGLEVTLVAGLCIGVIGAAVLSINIKKSILGLEPSEISMLLIERDTILQNLRHGIVAVDLEGNVILCNDIAKNKLGFKSDDKGMKIENLNSKLSEEILEVLNTEKEALNIELRLSPVNKLICNHFIMKNSNSEVIGVLSSFEDLTDAKLMAEELIGYESLLNSLRAQNHEFNNKLHTISGLIQLEEYKTVLNYITEIQDSSMQISNLIKNKIKNNHVAAILLAKYNKASESKIEFLINDECYLSEELFNVDHDDLCSVIGNLIDNSIDELIAKEHAQIELFILSNDLGIEIVVGDNGSGISDSIAERIFDRGVSTKAGSRGIGLFIVKEIVSIYNGTIEFNQDEGTEWNVFIPFNQ